MNSFNFCLSGKPFISPCEQQPCRTEYSSIRLQQIRPLQPGLIFSPLHSCTVTRTIARAHLGARVCTLRRTHNHVHIPMRERTRTRTRETQPHACSWNTHAHTLMSARTHVSPLGRPRLQGRLGTMHSCLEMLKGAPGPTRPHGSPRLLPLPAGRGSCSHL